MSNEKYYHRRIDKKQIISGSLETERNYWVYLPPGYNELLSYPLVICQDGLEFLNFGRIATHTNRLVLEEDMEPPIIIGVEVDMERRNEEYSPEGGRYERYCHFLTAELLPQVENDYPVRREPGERILAGDSLGGTVSLHMALDYPHLFRKVLSLSGAFMQPTLERISGELELSHLELYMLIGLEETSVKTYWGEIDFVDLNRRARELLESRGAEVVYKEEHGKHIWGFWQNELPHALRHFLKMK